MVNIMTSDEAHISLASEPRVQNQADSSSLDTENQSFDNDRLCPQCGQDHSHKLTGGSAIQEMISFLDRRYI
jgi:hypothetical protein